MLETGNISSMAKPLEKFLYRFVSSKPIIKKLTYLINIKKQPDKPLRSYLARFIEESFQILDSNDQVTIASFIYELLLERLTHQLHEDYSTFLDEF